MQGGRKKLQFPTNITITITIARKPLKIDRHMLRCVWPALNPLSIHVTLTAIFPGAYPGEAKMCKNVLKWRTFELTGWITGKRLKIDEYMLRCVWQALNPLFIRVTITAIVPGAYPWEAKMCLRLSCGSQMSPPAKRVKATTYRRDSREVAKLCLRLAETDARSVGDSHPFYLKTVMVSVGISALGRTVKWLLNSLKYCKVRLKYTILSQ